MLNEKSLEEELTEIADETHFNEEELKLLRMRYGLCGIQRANFKEMLKLLNTKPKLLKQSIESLDRKVFNYLKKNLI